ncbi:MULTISPECIES: ATP-binding cassette domain-containing protein [unclassified Lentimonas]|uniref:ATP-binding cassette domain-containing protein n=1 Tax=unclassified Lentimonas TaxID=2630993 RepID=UPI00132149F3|nr:MULTISPECIES: ATP-binding cassette domain-containing protein [unclassified Lentimonas]CAA6680146.1 COG0488: ATPase components of ABC transporters with duplicated ATPase domains [Lentimonas sp. CC4]CAA6685587.1 COG0488: ATPase components of ABC transporters with duplicated ATPase domains [Lentimonas sp. CC6]CAA6689669.1 COG0488: ATPase components of ABC transporters with duplicated ATPase domains [Lentimonas sp. CC19]CAA6692693.1 COG0488: ATPase components of ABC transporters with duplicated 
MLTFSKLSKGFGQKTLFTDISFRILQGERIGLVGPNGAGKTTLFNIILGNTEPDQGKIELDRGTIVGFLPQESAPAGEETVAELATSISPEFVDIYNALRNFPDPDAPERIDAQEQFVDLDGYTLEAKAKRILAGLAFRPEDFDKPAHTLSGGWIMRAHLARLLVMEPDILMLDEPTNHLDLETLGWFQNELCNYSGAILTISHDREFLNGICDGIIEIANGHLHRYHGNYDYYITQKAEREVQQLAAYNNQQREIAHLEDFVRRFRAKASKASQAQARMKTLEKMVRLAPPEAAADTISFSFPQPQRSGQRIATFENIQQAYGDHVVYTDLNLVIEKQERIVLVGPNGAGKSTLLKILSGAVEIQSGVRELGHNVSVGYFSQQRVDVLDVERTVLDEAMERVLPGMNEQKVRGILGAFLFRGDDVFKQVKVLSGGEKSRLALVKLLLNPPNLLLLDEPTTHLDMPSIDALIGALKDYTGTLVFVSHDVHFIRAIARRTVQIQAGSTTNFVGDYDYYLRKSKAASEKSGLVAGIKNARPDFEAKSSNKPKVVSAKERRRIEAEKRKLESKGRKGVEKRVAKLEEEVLKLEAEQAEITEQLGDPSVYANKEKAKELNLQSARVSKRLKEKNYEWEVAAEELSKLL